MRTISIKCRPLWPRKAAAKENCKTGMMLCLDLHPVSLHNHCHRHRHCNFPDKNNHNDHKHNHNRKYNSNNSNSNNNNDNNNNNVNHNHSNNNCHQRASIRGCSCPSSLAGASWLGRRPQDPQSCCQKDTNPSKASPRSASPNWRASRQQPNCGAYLTGLT
mmetsp:Transcript_72418/g.157995  ORF Transcript_72418/g.157995 Transcript_72418/m.157995 type:complete len:161 (+) Transcript_72418:187-669(+)